MVGAPEIIGPLRSVHCNGLLRRLGTLTRNRRPAKFGAGAQAFAS
jgi:hypothetical protein